MVRAAPPPKNVREQATTSRASSETDVDKNLKTTATTTSSLEPEPDIGNIKISEDESDTEAAGFSLRKKSSNLKKMKEMEKVKDDVEVVNDNHDNNHGENVNDNDEDNDEDGQPQPSPPKTKAQQKMFADVPLTFKENANYGGQIKPCYVRIKSLTQKEIDHLTTVGVRKANKRGRPRKDTTTDATSISPPKKRKMSPPKVHIKLAQNGGKQWASKLRARAPTPPPAKTLKSMPRGLPSDVVKRYGIRQCVVRVKRLKHSTNIIVGTSRKSKHKLSVSFNESVEILGSNSRKSSSSIATGNSKARSSLCSTTVPTRLQRVDATGNVVEDIELNPNMILDGPSTSAAAARINRSRHGNSNSGRRGRKPRLSSLRVPISGLASLSIEDKNGADDGADNETNDDEYIVPNELPEYQKRGVRRSGTPSPVKRVTTTTVSDTEDTHELEEDKSRETAAASTKDPETLAEVPEPKTEKSEPDALEELDKQEMEKLQFEPELEPPIQEQTSADPELNIPNQQGTREQRKSLTPEEEAMLEKEIEKELDSESDAQLELELHKKLKSEQAAKLEAELEAELDNEPTQYLTKTSPLYPAITITDDVTTDDILEIQTSIEDVRELQTPPSRLSSPTLPDSRSLRLDSPESDASFKSATEVNIRTTQIIDERTKSMMPHKTLTSNASESDLITPTASQNTFNGSDPASGSSIVQPPFSPIGDIPNLDDDELGQLVAPDYQLSNSRHAISRGTLDDIMTVLES